MRNILLLPLLLMVACGDERAQHASDARAGVTAARQAVQAGDPAADTILIGVDARLPAASGVNSADWPSPIMSPAQIRQDPGHYASSAPPEPARWGFVAALAGAGAVALGLIRLGAPLIPGAGPLIKIAADMAWHVMSDKDQKKADAAQAVMASAASALGPAVATLRAMDLPSGVRAVLEQPAVVAALATLSSPVSPGSSP